MSYSWSRRISDRRQWLSRIEIFWERCSVYIRRAVSRVAIGAVLVVGSAAPAAFGFTTRSLEEGFGPDGTTASEFAEPHSVAVDTSTGTIYVGDLGAGTIAKFDAAHQPEAFSGTSPQIVEGKLTGFGIAIASQLAVGMTTHDLYVVGGGAGVSAYQPDGEPADFTAGPGAGTNELAGAEACGVAVDGNGDIYESEFFSGIRVFEPSGEPLTTIPASEACNLAIDSHGDVYFDRPEGPVQEVKPSEFPVTALTGYSAPTMVDEKATWTVAADPSNDLLVDEGSQVGEYDPSGNRLGAFGSGGAQPLAASTGLAAGAAGTVYVTNDEGSQRQVQIFGPPSALPPSIDGASAKNLTGTSAELTAQIDPGGLSASYRFEYGTDTGYGTSVPIPDGQVGNGFGDVTVARGIEGLSPGVTYHWRVVATGVGGTNTGVDHTFVFDETGEGLPDGRAYEMVTPSQKNAALVGMVFKGFKPIVAEDGSRVLMDSIQCFGNVESCTGSRQTVGEPYLFSRTPTGWVATALAPPATRFAASSSWSASVETDMALFSMPTPPALEDDFYVRTPAGEFVDLGPATPPALGPVGLAPFDAGAMAATSDFSHFVFQAHTPWVSEEAGKHYQLYELLNSGRPMTPIPVAVNGGPGSTSLISLCGTSFNGNTSGNVPGTMSTDGEKIYFTAAACEAASNGGVDVPANTLYLRIGQARPIKVSEPSPTACKTVACQSSPPQDALFAGASNDGTKAFFLSNQRLTDSAGEEGNLYEYDLAKAEKGEDPLIDVSVGAAAGEAPAVQGVVALSTDGSHVYFVARGKLTSAPNGQGATAASGAYNLYVFARQAGQAEGRIAFIAQLPETDAELWNTNEDSGTANVTPDGRYLVFESHRDLTPDDNRRDEAVQIFRYDAQTGELIRISIGERGFNDNGNAGAGDAHIVPAYEGRNHAGPARSDPTMSDDGAFVFFESPIALTPHAVDNVQIGSHGSEPVYAQNVYEWHEGHVRLISDGKDTAELAVESAVKLIGSDTTGQNVFFRTADALLPQDTDTQIDYYDARICTATDPCIAPAGPPPPPCLGEVCHGAPAATLGEPTGGSETLNGPGNSKRSEHKSSKRSKKKARKRCSRRRRRAHARCMHRKSKRASRRGR